MTIENEFVFDSLINSSLVESHFCKHLPIKERKQANERSLERLKVRCRKESSGYSFTKFHISRGGAMANVVQFKHLALFFMPHFGRMGLKSTFWCLLREPCLEGAAPGKQLAIPAYHLGS